MQILRRSRKVQYGNSLTPPNSWTTLYSYHVIRLWWKSIVFININNNVHATNVRESLAGHLLYSTDRKIHRNVFVCFFQPVNPVSAPCQACVSKVISIIITGDRSRSLRCPRVNSRPAHTSHRQGTKLNRMAYVNVEFILNSTDWLSFEVCCCTELGMPAVNAVQSIVSA